MVRMLSKWVRMLPFSAHQVSCKCFLSSIVIMWDCFSKSTFRASQASFTVTFPLILRYNMLGIIDTICWNTMACSCKYWLISLRYLSIALACSAVGTVAPVVTGSTGLVTVPSKWLYRPRTHMESSSHSFHMMNPSCHWEALGRRKSCCLVLNRKTFVKRKVNLSRFVFMFQSAEGAGPIT